MGGRGSWPAGPGQNVWANVEIMNGCGGFLASWPKPECVGECKEMNGRQPGIASRFVKFAPSLRKYSLLQDPASKKKAGIHNRPPKPNMIAE